MTLPAALDELGGLRAARWIRESTRGQADRYGPASQREQQDRAIARHGLVDSGLAWEVAHSGRTVATTEYFTAMLAAAGVAYDILLVGYVSRFARDLETAVTARRQLHAAGAAVLFCDDGILSSEDEQWERWAREAVEAEAYSRRLGRRIRQGLAAKFRAGDQAGPAPLGFARQAPDARLVIDALSIGRAVALFERYAGGNVSTADLERETAIPRTAIRMLLANPLYNGWATLHRRGRQAERTPAPWRSQPPVDDELWDRVQAIRAARRRGSGGPKRRIYLLAGLAWCSSCGRRIKGDVAIRARDRGETRLYRHMDPCPAWDQGSYAASAVERNIDEQIRGIRLDAAWLSRIRALAGRRVPAPDRGELRRKQLERELASASTRLIRRELNQATFLELHDRIRAELDALEATPPQTEPLVDPDMAIAALRELRAKWRKASPLAKRQLVQAIFQRVTLAGPDIVEEELTPFARKHGLALALPVGLALARRTGVGARRAEPIRIVGRDEELSAARRARSA